MGAGRAVMADGKCLLGSDYIAWQWKGAGQKGSTIGG